MKKKTKIILTAATLTIFSLTITAYHWQRQMQATPPAPDVRPMLALTERSRDNTPPTHDKAVVGDESPKICTQIKDLPEPITTEPKAAEPAPPQPTEKEEPTNTPAPTTQTATKPAAPPAPHSIEPKMGDTRIVNGQKQSYFLGFGWVDYMGENEVIYCEGMYENGNKIGIMGSGNVVDSDGDINKMVGIMD